MDQKLPALSENCFSSKHIYLLGSTDPNLQSGSRSSFWATLIVSSREPKHLETEDFENWGYCPNPNVNNETYLAASLATWLSGKVFANSIAVRLETFLMSVDMTRGKRYSLDFPYLAWAY